MPQPYLSLPFLVSALCALDLAPAQAAAFSGKVVAIADGDTLTILTASKHQHRIRLAGIDAPEKRQPFGTRSRQSLSELCFGKQAEVISEVIDRYKRIVATVTCDGVNANAEQVHQGMAWVYRRYAGKHQHLYVLEDEARVAKRGLWSDPHPVAPWEWRNHKKQNVRAF